MIGLAQLKKMVAEQQLVENLHACELEKKGAPAFDLRLGELHEFAGEGFLGVDERKTPETRLLGKYKEGRSTKIVLEPNKYYIVKTVEKINTPKAVSWIVIPRSTIFRSGLLLLAGLGDPGFKGECTCGLINLNDKPFTIEMGARIANLVFYNVEGDEDLYIGTYHGGKIGTHK